MYAIYGMYKRGKIEEIDTAETEKEVEHMLAEYRLAFNAIHLQSDWQLWINKLSP